MPHRAEGGKRSEISPAEGSVAATGDAPDAQPAGGAESPESAQRVSYAHGQVALNDRQED